MVILRRLARSGRRAGRRIREAHPLGESRDLRPETVTDIDAEQLDRGPGRAEHHVEGARGAAAAFDHGQVLEQPGDAVGDELVRTLGHCGDQVEQGDAPRQRHAHAAAPADEADGSIT